MKEEKKGVKALLKNVFAVFMGLVFSLAIAEVILQIYNPMPATVKGDKIVLSANAKTVFVNNKNKKIASEIFATTNSIGFRGPNVPSDFDNCLSIITVGGSTTQCLYNNDSVTWPALTGEKLSCDFKNVWVNNAGLSGHTTFGHTILMNDYVVKLKPKIVLFLFGVNDVGIEKQSESFSLYSDDGQNMFFKKPKTFFYKSEVVGLCVNVSRYINARKEDLPHNLDFDLTKAEHVEVTNEQEKEMIYKTSLLIPAYQKRVEELAKSCSSNNIIPVFILQPVLYANTIDSTTGVNLATIKVGNANGSVKWKLLQMYNETTRKVAQRHNAFVIDLEKELPHDSKYYYDLVHFTDEGCRKISEIVSTQLKEYLKLKFPAYHLNR